MNQRIHLNVRTTVCVHFIFGQ